MDQNPTKEMRTQRHLDGGPGEDREKMAIHMPGERPWGKRPCPHLDLRLPTSSYEKTNSCCLSLWFFVMVFLENDYRPKILQTPPNCPHG